MAMSTMIHNHLPAMPHTGVNRNKLVALAHQEAPAIDRSINGTKASKRAARLAESLSNLLHLHVEPPQRRDVMKYYSSWESFGDDEKHSTPTMSPKEVISDKWREIHGCTDWDSLLDPLHPCLRREILKYGEFAQATYDAFDFDPFSEYCGSCRFNSNKIFEKLGLDDKHGYKVCKYMYAMSHIDMPQWLNRTVHLGDTWSRDSNWMGFVAISDEEETRRIGRRDIVVAWRGTVAPSEWYEDFQRKLEPIGPGDDAKVEHGFHSIYTSKSEHTRYSKSSASEQVMKEVTRLVKLYKEKGEEVSLTITGHSLGGALALLNAYEAAATIPGLPISVISFGAPRVGNIAFRDQLHQMGVKTLRVVVKQDLVPKMPGVVFNESLQKFDEITGTLDWVYTHVGAELRLDVRSSPYLKHGFNLLGFHSQETYLHLVDGFVCQSSSFREDARRDVALVNKACDMLVDELRIPHCWYQMENKGLVRNAHGRWVKPKREAEDVPVPVPVGSQPNFHALDEIIESRRLQPIYV